MSGASLTRARLNRGWRRLAIAAGLFALAVMAKTALSWDRGWYLSFNWTESLPHWAYLIDRKGEPQVGDYVDFWPPENDYYEGISFVKHVVAGPGDRVRCEGRTFYIGGRKIAVAKPVSQAGDPLTLGPCGVVPDGHWFVVTPHEDGFDSRYEEIGYVPHTAVRGVAHPVL